jgi:phosphoglycerate dehydrogenase-like enzyme
MNKTALVYVQYPQPYQQKLVESLESAGYTVYSVAPDNSQENVAKALTILENAEIAILGNSLPKQNLENASHLRWIHFDWVGIEGVLTKAMFKKERYITNGSGRNSICLAEHGLYFLFTLTYGTREILASQDAHTWGVTHINPYSCLFGKTILIVGAGSIGHEVAARAKAFGMKTIGYSRTEKSRDAAYDVQVSKQAGINLSQLTKDADFVVLTVALNSETYHLIDKSILEGMKKTAYIINICRGAVIEETALIEALKNRTIAGAGCDTFEEEPLNPASELWNLPTMVITPHSTPQSPLKFEQGISVVIENLKRLQTNEQMLNQQKLSDVLAL